MAVTISTRIQGELADELRIEAHKLGFGSLSSYLRHLLISKRESRKSTASTRLVGKIIVDMNQNRSELLKLLEELESKEVKQ